MKSIFTILLSILFPLCSISQIKFAMVGDYGVDELGELAVSELIKSWNPDFIVTLGDNNNFAGSNGDSIDYNIGKYYSEFIKPYTGNFGSGSLTENRFFPALGNHDLYDYLWINPDDIRFAGHTYYNYFKLTDTCIHKGNTPDRWCPLGIRYYKFRKGNAEFFILNTGVAPENHSANLFSEPDGVDSSSVQAQWFKEQILNSTAKWKFVILHHPPYSSTFPGFENSYSILRWNFRQFGVAAVFSGHNHLYESLIIKGVPYFICGTGGDERMPQLCPSYPGSRIQYISDFGALQCIEYEDSIIIRFINVQNQIIDSFRLVLSENDPGVLSAAPIIHGNVYTGTSNCYNVIVRNFGRNTLQSVPVYYKINDGSAVGPVNTVNIDPYGSAVVSFCGSNSFVPDTAGNYVLKFYAGFPEDTIHDNDTLNYNVTVSDSAKDAGIISLLWSGADSVKPRTNLSFAVCFKNFGPTDLAGIPVKMRINNSTVVSTALSGYVKSGDTTTVHFSFTPCFSGDYELKFFTALYGDINHLNDTAVIYAHAVDTLIRNAEVILIPEGLYDQRRDMLSLNDTVKSFLHKAQFPYEVIDSAIACIDSVSFKAFFTFANADEFQYYISVKHRNSLETWSRLIVNPTGGDCFTTEYDFTSDSSKAFGGNVVKVSISPVRYALYGGDVNQDGVIDLTDLIQIFNDASLFVAGYVTADLNGDSFVDLSDILLAYSNASKFISIIRP